MEKDIQMEKRLLSQLSKAELLQLLEIINDLQHAQSDAELENLLSRVTEVAGCDYSTCCLRRVDTTGGFLTSIKSVDGNFPRDWLDLYNGNAHNIIRLLPAVPRDASRTIVWSQLFSQFAEQMDTRMLERAYDLGLRDGVTLATASTHQGLGTLFSFSGSIIDHPARSALVLSSLASALHTAVLRLAPRPASSDDHLTERERETLAWIQKGKTNWEIAQILGISERTVKFHVQNILSKLKASSRSHAVALARSSNLIDL